MDDRTSLRKNTPLYIVDGMKTSSLPLSGSAGRRRGCAQDDSIGANMLEALKA